MGKIQKVPVVFYKTAAGVVVVREWLRSLPEADRNIIGRDLMRVQYRWPGWYAALSTVRWWSVGSAKRFAEQPYSTIAFLL